MLHFVMLVCAGRNIREHRWSKLRQRRLNVRAPQTQAVEPVYMTSFRIFLHQYSE